MVDRAYLYTSTAGVEVGTANYEVYLLSVIHTNVTVQTYITNVTHTISSY